MAAVLVTGGLGVIGAWVTRRLYEQDINVITYSRNIDRLLIKNIADKIKCISGDVLDLPKLIQTIKENDVDRIIHLSALMPGPLQANPYITYKINVDGTVNVLEAARLMDIKRVVYASSQAVYDKIKGRHGHPSYEPIGEDYPKNPINMYGVTKLFGEGIGFCYHQIYGVDFIAIRFAWVYGPAKQLRHGPLAIHSRMIESAMLGKTLRLPQGGDQISDNIYCVDAANGIVLACFAEQLKHRIFNIGTGKGESFRDLAETVNRIFGDSYVQIGPGLDPLESSDGNYMVMSIERASKEIGYTAEYDWERAVKHYIETMKCLDIEPVTP